MTGAVKPRTVERFIALARLLSSAMMRRHGTDHPMGGLHAHGRRGRLNACVAYIMHGVGCRYTFARSPDEDATIVDIDYTADAIVLDSYKVAAFACRPEPDEWTDEPAAAEAALRSLCVRPGVYRVRWDERVGHYVTPLHNHPHDHLHDHLHAGARP